MVEMASASRSSMMLSICSMSASRPFRFSWCVETNSSVQLLTSSFSLSIFSSSSSSALLKSPLRSSSLEFADWYAAFVSVTSR